MKNFISYIALRDVPDFENLQEFFCSVNKCTSLDVYQTKKLENLICEENPNLKELKINSALKDEVSVGFLDTTSIKRMLPFWTIWYYLNEAVCFLNEIEKVSTGGIATTDY